MKRNPRKVRWTKAFRKAAGGNVKAKAKEVDRLAVHRNQHLRRAIQADAAKAERQKVKVAARKSALVSAGDDGMAMGMQTDE